MPSFLSFHSLLGFPLWALSLMLAFAGCADAKEPSSTTSKNEEKKNAQKEKNKNNLPDETTVKTNHSLRLKNQTLRYQAQAGTLHLKNKKGEPTAALFFIAYIQEPVDSQTQRPITFCFNGGPGSSSVWLHLGLLGPQRVVLNQDGTALPPPYQLQDNPWTLLDKTDLVFIDPVSTGFSRAADPEKADNFHGLEADIESVGEFIRLYLTRHQRWASPKFLIGESYGTVRAVGLAEHLMKRHGLYLNGVMLVSSVLDFQTISFAPNNDLLYLLYLPSYAATAWYHHQLSPALQQRSLEELLPEVQNFALHAYATALLEGLSLPQDQMTTLAEQIAAYTSLNVQELHQANLRVPLSYFAKTLLQADNQVIGRFDSRFKGPVRHRLSRHMEYDPSFSSVLGVFSETLNHYVQTKLNYQSDLPYEILSNDVCSWDWGDFKNAYADVTERLAKVMTQNPHLKVHVSSGYYDLATPYFATDYTFNHLNIDPTLRANITIDYYPAGHMMYLDEASLKKQKQDLSRFIDNALKR